MGRFKICFTPFFFIPVSKISQYVGNDANGVYKLKATFYRPSLISLYNVHSQVNWSFQVTWTTCTSLTTAWSCCTWWRIWLMSRTWVSHHSSLTSDPHLWQCHSHSVIYTVVDTYHEPSEVTSIPFKLQYISVIHQVQFGSGVGQFLCARHILTCFKCVSICLWRDV